MLRIDFCGEVHELEESEFERSDRVFTIGRKADLVIDENPHLHRQFLAVACTGGVWWLRNVGSAMSAVLVDVDDGVEIRLPPGADVPIGFQTGKVRFEAGGTAYEIDIEIDGFAAPSIEVDPEDAVEGDQTTTLPQLTLNQRLVVLALAEPTLRSNESAVSSIPTSAQAAARLGIPLTSFNRRLDTVCEKFTSVGVRGLHGDSSSLMANRRVRLVEFAVLAGLVTAGDLGMLDSIGDH
jgi:hypothetical protein